MAHSNSEGNSERFIDHKFHSADNNPDDDANERFAAMAPATTEREWGYTATGTSGRSGGR